MIQKIKIKVIALICTIIQIFASIGISSFAVADCNIQDDSELIVETIADDSTNSINNCSSDGFVEISDPKPTYQITNTSVTIPGAISVTFDSINTVSCSLDAVEGLVIVNQNLEEMTFDLVANEEFGTITVLAQMVNGYITYLTIYTYFNGQFVYTSDISMDNAWHKCKEYEFENELMSLDEWHEQYSILTLSYSEPESNYPTENTFEENQAISEGKYVVKGRITWEINDSKDVLPLRFTKVELRYSNITGSHYISEGYTKMNGEYSFIFDPDDINSLTSPINLYVRIYAESNTFDVTQPFLEDFNFYDSNTTTVSTVDSRVINISQRIKRCVDYVPYKLMYIQQGMVVGQTFALENEMEINKRLRVFYFGNCNFDPENKLNLNNQLLELKNKISTINNSGLCYDNVCFIGYNKYDSFCTTIHEYGHYVENRMGNYGPAVTGQIYEMIPDNFNGILKYLKDFIVGFLQVLDDYSHYLTYNNFNKSTSKQFQMELVWSEAWATAFAKISFESCKDDYDGIVFDFDGINYETNLDSSGNVLDAYDGEAQEYAVISFLWDLYDGIPASEGETYIDDDNISMTAEQWWNITTQAGTYTLQDLTNNILENYPSMIGQVGEILTSHQIAPEVHALTTSPCVSGQLELVWDVNGSNTYPNDIFRVAFYDEDCNLIAMTDEITVAPTSTDPYCVPTDLWQTVMEHYEVGKTINAVVYGYRSGEPTSGPYFSTFLPVWSDSNSHIYNKEYNNTHHWNACACGVSDLTQSEHVLSYTQVTTPANSHVETCTDCGYFAYQKHIYNILCQHSDNKHTRNCACGKVGYYASHEVHSYGRCDKTVHYVYCECGYQIGTRFHVVPAGSALRKLCIHCGELLDMSSDIVPMPTINSTSGITYITDAGSYVDADGVIYLVDSDMELYLAGQLDVYALAENAKGYPTV